MVINSYDPIISEAARRFNVPEDRIRAVMGVESGGRAGAVSPKGASGLMQVMPGTYTDLARRHGFGPDRFDPRNNIFAGTAYLGEMYSQFGNWDEATAAYNMGPGRAMKVRNGTATMPAETVAYMPKVNAALGIQAQQEADVAPGLIRPRPGQATGMGSMFGAVRPNQSLTGLLEVDDQNNFYEGLGGLLNVGQTESQPPRTAPDAMPGTTQTDRMDVSGRINELLQQYMQGPQKQASSPLQYALAGMSGAVQPLAGVHDRKVGIGEILGALGGGLTRGTLAGQEAQQQQVGGELDKLLKVGAYGNQNRTTALNEANSIIDNRYKGALTQKALTPDRDAKVVGKGVYVNGKWEAAPWANGSDGTGPLEGTGIDAQMTNVYVTLSQKQASGQPLTPQETQMLQLSERHLMKPRLVTGPDGVVREVAPEPLPTLGGGAAAPSAAAPSAPAGGPASAGPAPAPTPAPPAVSPRVTEVVPARAKEIPATMQAGILANVSAVRSVENAITEATKAPDATGVTAGLLNMVPFGVVNKVMPGGTAARAAIADIASMKIHDRSGAAVTVSEFPRLAPFIPLVSDDDKTVQIKLKRFREELANEIRDQAAVYSEDQGYRGNPILSEFLRTGRAPRYEAPMEGAAGTTSNLSDDDIRRKLGL
jgi:hypothetical protein